MDHLIAWDLETVPDYEAAARLHGIETGDETAVREALGDKFPKHPLHKIACIGAVVAERTGGSWRVTSVGAPHIGERSEAELIRSFVGRIGDLRPQLVSFNGQSFDLPVLRYRAMLHRIEAGGLNARRYFQRYTEDALDLCDALSSFDGRSKMSLDGLCKVMNLPGKPEGMDGSKVDEYIREGRIAEVAAYCESDVVGTYRLFLIYELFAGRLSEAEYGASEAQLNEFLSARVAAKPHYAALVG